MNGIIPCRGREALHRRTATDDSRLTYPCNPLRQYAQALDNPLQNNTLLAGVQALAALFSPMMTSGSSSLTTKKPV